MTSVVVFGGYGTFGAIIAKELARFQLNVVVAGRNLAKAESFARQLGPTHRAIAADVTNVNSCRAALANQQVAVNCAGPFADQPTALVEACLQAGCHYADIADDRGYVRNVRSYDSQFAQQGLVAVYGCSSLPGISGALAIVARGDRHETPAEIRCTLFIGNRNPKGRAAVQSLVQGLGKTIAAPQGELFGFYDRERVSLPAPFGSRSVFNFDSPEYDLLPEQWGAASVKVKVGFQLPLATFGLAALAKLSSHWSAKFARHLSSLSTPLSFWGSSGGVVQSELYWPDGEARCASLCAVIDGQRMAALPCALAVRAICQADFTRPGTVTVYELFGAERLLAELQSAGFALNVA